MTSPMPPAGASALDNHLHEAFLQRAADCPEESDNGAARGAFLTMRLVDQFTGPWESPDARVYQVRATREYLSDLHPATTEVNHLREIVRVADGIGPTGEQRLLWPPLLAFAFWLEQELRLEEALDVLETAMRLGNPQAGEEDVATHLQRGRVLRRLARFDDARASYSVAGEKALAIGDRHSELLSRIGRAIVSQKVGNLPESERVLRAVLEEAQALNDRDAEARACQDLAACVYLMEQPAQAAAYAFRAFELYEQLLEQLRALSDVATVLKSLGHLEAARHALLFVIEAGPGREIRIHPMLELLDLATQSLDRVGFTRWRRELLAVEQSMSPDQCVEFEIKIATGLATFGNRSEARSHLERAVELADDYRLGEYLFRAEAILDRLDRHLPATEEVPAQSQATDSDVTSVIERVHALRV